MPWSSTTGLFHLTFHLTAASRETGCSVGEDPRCKLGRTGGTARSAWVSICGEGETPSPLPSSRCDSHHGPLHGEGRGEERGPGTFSGDYPDALPPPWGRGRSAERGRGGGEPGREDRPGLPREPPPARRLSPSVQHGAGPHGRITPNHVLCGSAKEVTSGPGVAIRTRNRKLR